VARPRTSIRAALSVHVRADPRSAFDITGKGIANPVARFWTASQMLDHLGEADAIGAADARRGEVTGAGITTPDVGGTATTRMSPGRRGGDPSSNE